MKPVWEDVQLYRDTWQCERCHRLSLRSRPRAASRRAWDWAPAGSDAADGESGTEVQRSSAQELQNLRVGEPELAQDLFGVLAEQRRAAAEDSAASRTS